MEENCGNRKEWRIALARSVLDMPIQFARHRHRYKHKKIPGTMKSPRDSNLIALALLLVATLLVVYLL